jgi:hypothetical protein
MEDKAQADFFRASGKLRRPRGEAKASRGLKPTLEETGFPEHHRVLIAAAVAVACDGARILGIVATEPDRDTGWEQWGRANIHASHDMPAKDGINRQLTKRDPGTRNQ